MRGVPVGDGVGGGGGGPREDTLRTRVWCDVSAGDPDGDRAKLVRSPWGGEPPAHF